MKRMFLVLASLLVGLASFFVWLAPGVAVSGPENPPSEVALERNDPPVQYLPVTFNNKKYGYWGWVTFNSQPVNETLIELRLFNGVEYVTYMTTRTDPYGFYQFPNPPVLAAGQSYYIRWLNPKNPENRDMLDGWWCKEITPATQETAFTECRFDVLDIRMIHPVPGDTIGIPYTFYWQKRPFVSDSYEFNLFDPADLAPWWWTSGLGYVDMHTLFSLPPGFVTNTYYAWTIRVYGSNGYGIANEFSSPVEFMPVPQGSALVEPFSWADWLERVHFSH